MTPLNLIVLFTVAGALGSFLVLMPLARLIPLSMTKEWHDAMIDEGHQPAQPLVETDFNFSVGQKLGFSLLGGLIAYMTASIYPSPVDALALCGYLLGVLLLVAINLKHQLLPDQIVLTLLWLGLLRAAGCEHLAAHVLGAAACYAGPFLVLGLVKLVTGKQILGGGDLKALAMAGAWFGITKLPLIFIVFIGTVILMMVIEAILKRKSPLGTGWAHLLTSMVCVLIESPSLEWIRE